MYTSLYFYDEQETELLSIPFHTIFVMKSDKKKTMRAL